MAKQDKMLLAFNRGVVSKIGLARVDLERMSMSAEIQRNFMPRVLGSMMLRPGLEFIDEPNATANFCRNLPFIFGVDDTVLIEAQLGTFRFRDENDDLITKPAVTAVIANSDFSSSVPDGNWLDQSQSGGVISYDGTADNALIKGDGTDFGILRQQVTLNESGVEHFIEVLVTVGPVRFKVGSTAGDDDYVEETRLGQGQHFLAFTPTTDFWVELANEREFNARVNVCRIAIAGPVTLVHPYSEDQVKKLRWTQSGDVIYLATENEAQYKLERRGTGRSWSIVLYLPEDGPFRNINVTGVTIAPSALNGDIQLSASEGIFRNSHVTGRSLWRIDSVGQIVTKQISSDPDETDSIRVSGSGNARQFGIIIEGTFVATVTLQFSFTNEAGSWIDQGTTFTVPTSTNFNDQQDGQIIYYRLAVKAGDYTSGPVTCTLTYTGGSIQGVARATGFQDSQTLDAVVLKDFGSTVASKNWYEGEWSDRRGWPTAVDLHEARLFWAGNDKLWGSVVDAFESFDDNVEGDSGPISRSVGFGPIRVVHWLKSLGRLMFGTSENSANVDADKMDGNSVLGARSNSFDEPLTPFNFNIKTSSSKAVFVDRTEQRLYELLYDLDQQDYRSVDLSIFAPDFNEVGITRIAVQMKPDVRVHCVRSDGTVGVLVYDRIENVIAWIDVDSPGASGEIVDVAVLPGRVEDQVYYTVKRTINSSTVHHISKWALESEAQGGTVNKIADSFFHYSGPPTSLPFQGPMAPLVGEQVVVWADGVDIGTYTVDAPGHLDISPILASEVVAGLGYTAQFKSAKLGEAGGIGLLERKKVNRLGFIAKWLHAKGLQYGPSFTELYDLPEIEDGSPVGADTVHEDYHEDNFPFGGDWDTDSRICLQASAPRPCTLLAALAIIESVEIARRRPS